MAGISLSQVLGAATGALALYWLVRIATGDCNVWLAHRTKIPPEAFKRKVVWITGASQGLGEELALVFARQGAFLILSARRKEQLERVKAACLAANPECKAEVLTLDLCGSEDDIAKAAEAASSFYGGAGVEVVVHNAGASQSSLVTDTAPSVDEQMMRLNVLGPMTLTKKCLPGMLERGGGRFVVVSSMAAKLPSPGQATYAACKFGLQGFFASMASELADRNIRVTLACPGPIGTGTESNPRTVFGKDGVTMVQSGGTGMSKSRLTPPRAAQLIVAAAAAGMDEVWLAKNPVLAIGYIFQFLPGLGWAIMKLVGPSRARSMGGGPGGKKGDGYSVGKILKGVFSKKDA
ncbi:unnamed protein product [Pedinophyceae sp. YPF-701]|nr:unnamed protein product [Pedinophyceae sp. YPF-701]